MADEKARRMALELSCPCCESADRWAHMPHYARVRALEVVREDPVLPPLMVSGDLTDEDLDRLAKSHAGVMEVVRIDRPMFHSAEDLAAWLESMFCCTDDGALTGPAWPPAQVAAAALRAHIAATPSEPSPPKPT